jgi:hypothetical protein
MPRRTAMRARELLGTCIVTPAIRHLPWLKGKLKLL